LPRTPHRSPHEYIAGPAARLLGQFDLDDVETTALALQAPRSWPQRPTASSARYSLGIR
jgi:hypothetical protein